MPTASFRLPDSLEAAFAKNGWARIKDFAAATGIAYPNVLRRIQCGDIPAVDISRGDGERSQWRLYEEPVRQWLLTE